jgi:hypothetical protein
VTQIELTMPAGIDLCRRRGNRAVQVARRRVVGRLAGDLLERHIFRLTIRPRDMNTRRRIRRGLDLGDHEMPLMVVAFMIRQCLGRDLLRARCCLRRSSADPDDAVRQQGEETENTE